MGESWHLLLPLKISLFQMANQKNLNSFKNPMSPVPFVSRAKALLAKRSKKGYGDENEKNAIKTTSAQSPLKHSDISFGCLLPSILLKCRIYGL